MIVFFLLLALLFTGCKDDAAEPHSHVFRVLSYNVQNLFDARLDGTEYKEYLPSKSWTELSYRMRLKTLASVLTSKQALKADVLILQEVENERVIEDLLSLHLARKGYQWYACAGQDGGAVRVAMITRIKPSNVRVHAVPGARPVLEANFPTERGTIVVLGLHAKSQIGEKDETEALRIELAKTLTMVASSHQKDLVLFCGDFNEDPPKAELPSAGQTALVHETHPKANAFVEGGSIAVTGRRSPLGPGLWYNPCLDSANTFSVPGSCNWGGIWHQYDQILGNGYLFDDLGWEFSSYEIANPPLCLQSDGKPFAWNLSTLNGVSDHLPVVMTLRRK